LVGVESSAHSAKGCIGGGTQVAPPNMHLSHKTLSLGRLLKATVSRIAGGTFVALASLFIVNVGVAEAATPLDVQSITWNGSWYVVNLTSPSGLATSSSLAGVLPMKGLYGGGPMNDLYPNNTQDQLKCESSLVASPSFVGTSTMTINIDDASHNGTYNGPWASNAGVTDNCTGAGVYYHQFGVSGSATTYYFQYYWDGTAIQEITPEWWLAGGQASSTYSTKFNNATFTATSSTIGYYISTADFVGQFDRPDVILLNIASATNTQVASEMKLILPLTTGNATTTIDYSSLADGSYTATVNFWNMATQGFVFSRSGITVNFTVSGGVVTTQTVVQKTDGTLPPSESFYQECGLTALSGCISNAFRFLFYPSTESIDTFMSAYSQLSTRVPFVYAYQASDLMTGLYTGASQNVPTVTIPTPIGDITFISQDMINDIPFVELLRSLIAAGLWLMLFVVIYRKTLTIHDKQATV